MPELPKTLHTALSSFRYSLSCVLGGHLKAATAVRLHVPHSADGLDLRVVRSPVVPVLVGAHLEHVLVTAVARVLVTHPAAGKREGKWEDINEGRGG